MIAAVIRALAAAAVLLRSRGETCRDDHNKPAHMQACGLTNHRLALSLIQRRGELLTYDPHIAASVHRRDGTLQDEASKPPQFEAPWAEPDFTDYRSDIRAFLQDTSLQNLSMSLPRVSLSDADRAMQEIRKQPIVEENLAKESRSQLAQKLFGGPGIVDGVTNGWQATRTWDAPALKDRLTNVSFLVKAFQVPGWVQVRKGPRVHFSEYIGHGEGGHGFFLFALGGQDPEYQAIELLRSDTQPRPGFTCPNVKSDILAFDGAGSSHGFHFHGAVWQTQIKGRKAWWLLAPNSEDTALQRVAPVVQDREYAVPNGCALLNRLPPPPGSIFFVAEPGETLLLPEGWWHTTCALDEHTAAIGGWLSGLHYPCT